MTHTYQILGMTCDGCTAKVKSELLKLPDVLSAEVYLETGKATVSMQKHIATADLQKAISNAGKYTILEDLTDASHYQKQEVKVTWFQTYKPVILIYIYITVITLTNEYLQGGFQFNDWMRHFMAGFFLAFSFFKLLNVSAFAASYAGYDIVAKKIPAYGYIYPFIELALAIFLLIPSLDFYANIATLVVMSVSIAGVIQSVLNKKQVQCACLGSAFNLPVGWVTIFEDGLMIIMSSASLLMATLK